jgi:23S rRNA (guanosine2251-2'-O)-methyltransferase
MKNRRSPSPSIRKQQGSNNRTESRVPSNLRVSLGFHAVREAVKVRKHDIARLLVRKNWESSKDLQDIVREARRLNIDVEERSSENLDKFGHNNQGVACEIKGRPSLGLQELGAGVDSTVLALDGVEDPHNLGAILRTAWLMGVEAILIPTDRAVGLVPTVHKVSCGGVEHVPLIEVPNLSNALTALKEKGFWVFGLASGGANTLSQIKIPEKIIWVLGAEDKGLRTTTERACDELVSIPQIDNAASYNVSVATGITLYETRRQSSI